MQHMACSALKMSRENGLVWESRFISPNARTWHPETQSFGHPCHGDSLRAFPLWLHWFQKSDNAPFAKIEIGLHRASGDGRGTTNAILHNPRACQYPPCFRPANVYAAEGRKTAVHRHDHARHQAGALVGGQPEQRTVLVRQAKSRFSLSRSSGFRHSMAPDFLAVRQRVETVRQRLGIVALAHRIQHVERQPGRTPVGFPLAEPYRVL